MSVPILMLHASAYLKIDQKVFVEEICNYAREVKPPPYFLFFFPVVGCLQIVTCLLFYNVVFKLHFVVGLGCSLRGVALFCSCRLRAALILRLLHVQHPSPSTFVTSKKNLSCHIAVKELGMEIFTLATWNNKHHFSKIFLPFDVSTLFYFINCLPGVQVESIMSYK